MPCPMLPGTPFVQMTISTSLGTWTTGPGVVLTAGLHCHVEGCEWDQKACGLAKVYVDIQRRAGWGASESEVPDLLDRNDIAWACGARRLREVI